MTTRSTHLRHRTVPHLVTWAGLAAATALGLAACGSAGSPAAVPAQPTLDASGAPAGIEHFRRWSDRLAQGGEPRGEVAFANLAAMGYRTIVSVDGARPDVETARRYGLRYVHAPFGYDGVPADAQAVILQAAKTSDGPVYVHCHHGLHRGPAGAMVVRVNVEGVSGAQAVDELKASGCSEHYKGLYRDVLALRTPGAEVLAKLPADLPSYVPPGDIAQHMADVSRTWERIGHVKAANWGRPPAHPDVDPPHESRILWEGFREMQRLDEARAQGGEFLDHLRDVEESGVELERALVEGAPDRAAKAHTAIKRACDGCHDKFRD